MQHPPATFRGLNTEHNKVLLDTSVVSCLLAVRGEDLKERKDYEDLLAGMQYAICPITEAESLRLIYTRNIGDKRVAEQREFLKDIVEILHVTKPDKDKPKKNKKSLLGFLGSLWIRSLPS